MRIEKLVYGGDGLARVDGRVMLVPFVLPGELVRVETERERPDLLRGRAKEILEPNAARTKARCPHFGRCGGCQYQHAAYSLQVEQKREILAEVLRRLGKFEAPGAIDAVTGPEWGYRNRIQLHFHEGRVGFHRGGSHQLEPVEECPVASPRLNEALQAIRGMTGDRRWPWFLKSLELFTNEREVQLNVLDSGDRKLAKSFFDWCSERIPGAIGGAIEYEAGGDRFRVSYRSFFQVNRFLVERLVEQALGDARGAEAWDLYSGVGLFALPLARRFGRVRAVESSSSAVRDLGVNAERAGVAMEAEQRPALEFLAAQETTPELVVADPPRTGLGPDVVRELVRLKPQAVVIVSCDPATLARDLRGLVGAGYRVEAMTVVDLFPQTQHIETVTRLRLG